MLYEHLSDLPELCPEEGPLLLSQMPSSLWSHCLMHAFQAEALSRGLHRTPICPGKHVLGAWEYLARGTPPLEAVTSLLQLLAHSPAVLPAAFHTEAPVRALALPQAKNLGSGRFLSALCVWRRQRDLSTHPQTPL